MSSPPNSPHKPKKGKGSKPVKSTGEGTGRYNHRRLDPVDSDSGPNNPGTGSKINKYTKDRDQKAEDAAKRRKKIEEQDKKKRQKLKEQINENQERAEKNKEDQESYKKDDAIKNNKKAQKGHDKHHNRYIEEVNNPLGTTTTTITSPSNDASYLHDEPTESSLKKRREKVGKNSDEKERQNLSLYEQYTVKI